MSKTLIVGFMKESESSNNFLLGKYSVKSELFPDEWFFPSVLDHNDEESALDLLNKHAVEQFGMDFWLRVWYPERDIVWKGEVYKVSLLEGVLIHGIFEIRSGSIYEATRWTRSLPTDTDYLIFMRKILNMTSF